MIIVRSSEIKLNRPIRLIHPRHPIYIVPRENNLFMIGATTIESESETEMSVYVQLVNYLHRYII